MNISRLSTLLPSLAIAVITLGLAAVPALADPGDDDGCHEHKEECGGGGDVAEYSVTISGAMTGASDHNWRGNFGGKKNIGLNDAAEGRIPGEFTDLSIFTSSGGPFDEVDGNNGQECFLVPAVIHQGNVSKGRGGRAQAGFFFDGLTFEQVNNMDVPVLYGLVLTGVFSTNTPWPPTAGNPAVLTMTAWELSATNEGKAIKSISCIGKGATGVTITVTGPL